MDIRKDYIELATHLIHSIYTLRDLMDKFQLSGPLPTEEERTYYAAARKNFMVNLYILGPSIDNLLKLEELKDYYKDLETMKKQYKEIAKQCNDTKTALGLVASH